MKTALVAIDLQNDFTQKQGKVPACTEQVPDAIRVINQAMKNREGRGGGHGSREDQMDELTRALAYEEQCQTRKLW